MSGLWFDPLKVLIRSYSVAGGSGKAPRVKMEIECAAEEMPWLLQNIERAQAEGLAARKRQQDEPRAATARTERVARARQPRAPAHQPLLQIPHFKD